MGKCTFKEGISKGEMKDGEKKDQSSMMMIKELYATMSRDNPVYEARCECYRTDDMLFEFVFKDNVKSWPKCAWDSE